MYKYVYIMCVSVCVCVCVNDISYFEVVRINLYILLVAHPLYLIVLFAFPVKQQLVFLNQRKKNTSLKTRKKQLKHLKTCSEKR